MLQGLRLVTQPQRLSQTTPTQVDTRTSYLAKYVLHFVRPVYRSWLAHFFTVSRFGQLPSQSYDDLSGISSLWLSLYRDINYSMQTFMIETIIIEP